MKDDILLVGNKPFINYIRSLELIFKQKNKEVVTLVARGQNMKKAIDITEASRNKFLNHLNIAIQNIKISTEKFYDENEIERSVSCIQITLTK